MTAKRIDANQHQIVADLRKAGCLVVSLAAMGDGLPDLLVGYNGHNFLLEIKSATGKLTPDQKRWHLFWNGQIDVVHNSTEALRAIGAVTDDSLV